MEIEDGLVDRWAGFLVWFGWIFIGGVLDICLRNFDDVLCGFRIYGECFVVSFFNRKFYLKIVENYDRFDV